MRTSKSTRFSQYSLNSPYGHLYNMDTSLSRTVRLVPEMPKIIYITYLYNTDTSVKWTLGSVPFGVRIKEGWKYKVVCARELASFWRENEIAVVILQRVLATMQ